MEGDLDWKRQKRAIGLRRSGDEGEDEDGKDGNLMPCRGIHVGKPINNLV
jgi:hypothetical protein